MFTDTPITDESQDLLRRLPLAIQVANLIRAVDTTDSYVIGIEGAWGSGKTSFINLVRKQLASEENIKAILFNPWLYSGQNELLADFFESLSQSMKGNTKEASGFLAVIKSYSSKLAQKTEVTFDPEFTVPGFKFRLGQTKTTGGQGTLSEIRADLDKRIEKLGKKFVVYIDDIDRLDPSETKLVFRLVKLMANFPRTIFVLAYDRERVEQRLDDMDHEFRGSEYLKKIIQLSFTLPEPDKEVLWDVLIRDINGQLRELYGTDELGEEEDGRWSMIFHNGLSGLFTTLRDVRRYTNSLRLMWPTVKHDVNPTDFVALEAIRVFAPHFYNSMPSNKLLFTSAILSLYTYQKDKKEAEAYYLSLLDKIPDDRVRRSVDGLCKELFPALAFKEGYSGRDYRKKRRICAEERYAFYFQFGIPKGSISDEELIHLTRSPTREELEHLILSHSEAGSLNLLLSKTNDYLEQLSLTTKREFVQVLIDKAIEVDAPSSGFNLSMQANVGWIADEVLRSVNEDERVLLLRRWMSRTAPLAYRATILTEQLSYYDSVRGRDREPVVPRETLLEFMNNLVEEMRQSCGGRQLTKQPNWMRLLYIWNMYGRHDEVEACIDGIVATTDGLLRFMCKFVEGSKSPFRKRVFRHDHLSELYSIEKIEHRVKALSLLALAGLSGLDKEAIELFASPSPEDYW